MYPGGAYVNLAPQRSEILQMTYKETHETTFIKMKTIRTLLLCTSLLAGTVAAQENSLVLSNGLGFVDTPYKAGTLEVDDAEDLIINCDEVDCTTFVEYALAMALCPQQGDDMQESDFARNLQRIRYRDGKIDGYTSRLHYISDWINNGVRQGFLEDVTAAHSPFTQKLSISYMSTHPQLYKSLKNSPENVAQMAKYEKALSGKEVHYLPKDKLEPDGLPWIKNGDIIALTTNTPVGRKPHGHCHLHQGTAAPAACFVQRRQGNSRQECTEPDVERQKITDRYQSAENEEINRRQTIPDLSDPRNHFDAFRGFFFSVRKRIALFPDCPFCFSTATGSTEDGKQDFSSRKARVLCPESGVCPERAGISMKEVSIRPERRLHSAEMLTSFQIISICFPTLHLLLWFYR